MTEALFKKYSDELWNIAAGSRMGDWYKKEVFHTVLRQMLLLNKKEGE